MKRYSALLLLVTLFAGSAYANVQSLESIQAAAVEFVRERIPENAAKHYISASSLDPRLRLHACEEPLDTFSSSARNIGARTTVGVRCPAESSWTLYVPVTLEVEVPVLVLRRALARRARITVADVEPQVRRVPGSATNFIDDISRLQGHSLKRALPAGTALTVEMLKPDILVKRGQQVTLIAEAGGVEIRARGEALSDGSAHERVRVQNVTSLKVVEGVVESDSVVRVGL